MVPELIGVKLIKLFMLTKKKNKKQNPYAQELKQPKYKQRIVKSKKTYSRKKNKKIV